MNLAIIVEARHIPSGTRVYKPTGTKEYVLWVKGVPAYDVPNCDKKTFLLADHYVIQSISSINVISPDTLLKILCDDISYARHVLDIIEDNLNLEDK